MNRQIPLSVTYILLILAMLFYGISFVSTKVLLDSYNPVAIVWLRLLISTSLLFGIESLSGRLPKIQKGDLKYFFLLALFQPFFYFLSETYGLNLVSPSITAILIATIPVFTPLFSVPLLKEKVTLFGILGMLLSFAGVAVIVLGDPGSSEFSFLGIFLIFGAVLSAVAYSVIIKKIPLSYSPVTIVRYQNLLGLIYFFPLFVSMELKPVLSVPVTSVNLSHLLFLAILPSTASFIFMSNAIRIIGPSKTNVFTNTIPIYTSLLSFFFLGETFSLWKIIGIVIVLLGVFLSQLRKQATPLVSVPEALACSSDEPSGLPK